MISFLPNFRKELSRGHLGQNMGKNQSSSSRSFFEESGTLIFIWAAVSDFHLDYTLDSNWVLQPCVWEDKVRILTESVLSKVLLPSWQMVPFVVSLVVKLESHVPQASVTIRAPVLITGTPPS